MRPVLTRGQFVTVNKKPGVVVGIYSDRNVPEDHVAVWFGETSANGDPRVKTVPEEDVSLLEKPAEYYH
jgi:hypothetical protein